MATYLNHDFVWTQMRQTSVALLISTLVLAANVDSASSQPEDQIQTCEAILGQVPAGKHCKDIFPKNADCCIQYNPAKLADLCRKMPDVRSALLCFTEIHEVGFWKTDLLPENEPGLGASYAEQWKRNVKRVCTIESSNAAAIDCAILQKSGIKFVFRQANDAVADDAKANDPILNFCRDAFGEYWEGVERCVEKQRAAKRRLGL